MGKKTVHPLKAALGAVLAAFFGLFALSAGICFVVTLIGGLEIPKLSERILCALLFALAAAGSAWAARFGLRLCQKTRPPRRPEPKKAAPQVRKTPPVRQTKPAVVRNEPKPETRPSPPEKRRETDMPDLLWDASPFAAYSEEDAYLDEFDNQSSVEQFYLLRRGASIRDAVEQYLERHPDSGYAYIRIADEKELEGCDADFFRFCAAHHIRIVRHEGGYGIYDYAERKKYEVHVESWPGSVDDAATYGRWSF